MAAKNEAKTKTKIEEREEVVIVEATKHKDFRKKLVIARAVSTDSNAVPEFCNNLARQSLSDENEIKALAKKLEVNMYKYFNNPKDQNPKNYELMRFCTKLLSMGTENDAIRFAQMGIQDWVEALNYEYRKRLLDCINELVPENEIVEICKECGIFRTTHGKPNAKSKRNTGVHEDLHPIYLDVGKFEFLDRSKHDTSELQKYMYFDSIAVNNWQELISNPDKNYPNYRDCKASLFNFLNSEYWTDLVKNNKIGRTVNLGAGTPDKDRAIITSSIDQMENSRQIKLPTHYIVDTSLYMLLETVKELCFSKIHNHRITESEIITVSGDFMYLSKLLPQNRPEKSDDDINRSAFFMLGGTIGNINPTIFMESISKITNKGDLLVITSEFMPEVQEEIGEFMKTATASYNHRLAKQLVMPAARAVLRSKKYATLIDQHLTDAMIIDRLKATAEIVSGSGKHLPNVLKIVFRYDHDGIAFDVVEANRYVKSEFKDFVMDRGFSFVGSHGAGAMKQVVFEKS